MTGGPVITFPIQEPYSDALKTLRSELRRNSLHIVVEVDVANRIRRELGAGVAPCRILYVDDPVLLLEGIVFNRGVALGIPQPIVVCRNGNGTQVLVRSSESAGGGVPASTHEPLRELHSRILRTIAAIGQREGETCHAMSPN